jgi:hypothetical protein
MRHHYTRPRCNCMTPTTYDFTTIHDSRTTHFMLFTSHARPPVSKLYISNLVRICPSFNYFLHVYECQILCILCILYAQWVYWPYELCRSRSRWADRGAASAVRYLPCHVVWESRRAQAVSINAAACVCSRLLTPIRQYRLTSQRSPSFRI